MLSKNGVGLIILALSLAGLDIEESVILDVISSIGTLVSFTLLVWNQLKRVDTKWFIFKK